MLLLPLTLVMGQFTIVNTLKTTDASNLKIGDNAYLTAVKGVDANGAGFLRLTEAKTNQKGYMYVMDSFPTTMGFIADFEYKAWRNVADNTYFGADGFTFFMFDGAITDANFKLGGYGGSLGYATFSNPANTNGLSGGYIGIGFDAFGNYIRAVENRNGLTGSDYLPNSVVIRGPSSPTYALSNVYLASAALGNRTGTLNDIRKRDEIDYNTTTTTRPADNVFYRRVQVSIVKGNPDYTVTIRWRKQNETTFTDILTYRMSASAYPLPARLKIGFAGSTGGGFNAQEIRNILLTTPGNLRVDSRSNTAFVCNDKVNEIIYRVEVTNDTASSLSGIKFNSKILDKAGAVVPQSQFKITSITTTGFTSSTIPATNSTNQISGDLGLGANKSGIVTITGQYFKNSMKNNLTLNNVSTIESPIPDEDPSNNTTTTSVNILKCGLISNPVLPSYPK